MSGSLSVLFPWTKKVITLKPSLWEIVLDMVHRYIYSHRATQQPVLCTQSFCSNCLNLFIFAWLHQCKSNHWKSSPLTSLDSFVRADAAGIGMFWLASQVRNTNTRNLLTSDAESPPPPPPPCAPHSPRILSYLARWGSVPLKTMELNSPSNVWSLCTLRCTVQFNQILGHKINRSTFGIQQIFEFHLTF